MRGKTPAGLQLLVRVLGHGDIFCGGLFNDECDDEYDDNDFYNDHFAGGSNHSWLLGACSE